MGLRLRLSDYPGDAELSSSYPLAAQDAAEALIALGWLIQPHGFDMESWQNVGIIRIDDELITLAARWGGH